MASDRPKLEPVHADENSITGASLIELSPQPQAIEVAQANPGLCAVLENAALLYASGQAQGARALLEQGIGERPRHEAVAARLARAVRPAAAGRRPECIRPARAPVLGAIRAVRAGLGRQQPCAERRAEGGRRVSRDHRQADRRKRIADRGRRRAIAKKARAREARPVDAGVVRRRGRADAGRRARRSAPREARVDAGSPSRS